MISKKHLYNLSGTSGGKGWLSLQKKNKADAKRKHEKRLSPPFYLPNTRARSLLNTVVSQGDARWVDRLVSGVVPVVYACAANPRHAIIAC
jgi:hypothetical protein